MDHVLKISLAVKDNSNIHLRSIEF